jgi:site-specific DNA-methyltransferase (adenine-specific)
MLSKDDAEIYADRCVDTSFEFSVENLLGNLICDNAFEIFPLLPKKFVDLLIVDPPYNLSKKYGESCFSKMKDEEYQFFTERWIDGIKPALKNTAAIYVCCDWNTSMLMGRILSKHFNIQNRITWQREKGRGAARNWKNAMEDIWFATVSEDFVFNVDAVKMRRRVLAPYRVAGEPKDWIETGKGNFRDTFPSNFWDDISIPFWSMPENTVHPTQKPEKLFAKLILASSNERDVVFDPFLGVGTSAVVAKKLNRRYSGIEREREYCALAQKRLEMAEVNSAIQGYADRVFWERNTLLSQRQNQITRRGC